MITEFWFWFWYFGGAYALLGIASVVIIAYMKEWMIGTPWYRKALVGALWPVVGGVWLWAILFDHLRDGKGQELSFDSDGMKRGKEEWVHPNGKRGSR